MSTEQNPVHLRPRRPCPLCGKPSRQNYHPFCSAHCADVDLNRWLGGRYAIPTESGTESGEKVPPEQDS
jgi:uncharacterized protein